MMPTRLLAMHNALSLRTPATRVGLILTSLTWLITAGCNLGQRELEDTTPPGCAECHIDITRQWERSAHSIAWTSPAFVKASLEHQKEYCLPCHASQPLFEQRSDERAQLRTSNQHFGVDCNVCHQRGCEYVGPYNNRLEAHPTAQDIVRLPCADFCGTCHHVEMKEFTEFNQSLDSEEQFTGCAACHMPAYKSRLTQGHVLSYIHPKRTVRDHSFPIWVQEVAGDAVEIADVDTTVSKATIQVDAILINRGAGHNIPVGGFGHHELVVRVEMLTQDDSLLSASEQSIFPGDENRLPPKRPVAFSFRMEGLNPAEISRIRILAEHVNESRSVRFTLGERLLDFPTLLVARR